MMAKVRVDGTPTDFVPYVRVSGDPVKPLKIYANQSGTAVEVWPLQDGIYGAEWESDSPLPELEWLADAETEPTLLEGTYGAEWESNIPSPYLRRIR